MFSNRWLILVGSLVVGLSIVVSWEFIFGECRKDCNLATEYCWSQANSKCDLNECYQWRMLSGDYEIVISSCWHCGKNNGGEGADGYCHNGNPYLVCKKKTQQIIWRKRGGCGQTCKQNFPLIWLPTSSLGSGPENGVWPLYLCEEKPS